MCRIIFLISFRLFVLCLCLSAPVHSHDGEVHSQESVGANLQAAIHWLESRQRDDGSFSSSSDSASVDQATSQAALALLAHETTTFAPSAALKTLQSNLELLSTERLARLIRVLTIMNEPVSDALTELLKRRGADGGFGYFSGYQSTPLDTAHALLALQKVGADTAYAAAAVNYLSSAQLASGAFGLYEDQASLEVTAQVVKALKPYLYRFALGDTLRSAMAVMYSSQRNVRWGDDWETALALQALVPLTTDVTRYQPAARGLADRQALQGHWDDSVYTTALALSAFTLLGSVDVPVDPEKAVITGVLLDADSGQPIGNAKVDLLNGSAPGNQLNDDGSFAISGLEPGAYMLGYSAPGYLSASQNVSVKAGQFVNVGTIRLSVAPSTSLIKGIVKDGLSDQPLSGSVVEAVVGASRTSAITDAEGRYQLLSEPGAATLTASLPGYHTAVANSDLRAGSVVNFSPPLLPSSQPEITASSIHGRLINSNELPLELVSIQLSDGASVISTQSDAQGYFEMLDIAPGDKTLQLQKAGYETMVSNLIVPQKSRVNVGDITLKEKPTLPVSSITGRITDMATGSPVAGAQISVNGKSTRSDNNGFYHLSDIQVLEFTVSVTASGYLFTDKLLSLSEHADISLDIPLRSASLGGVTIAEVATDKNSYTAYEPVYISAVLENNTQLTQRARLFVRVLDEDGAELASFTANYLPPLDPDSSPDEIAHYQQHLEDTIEEVQPGQRREISFEQWWNTQRIAPGSYLITVQAFDGATSNLVSEKSTSVEVVETRRLLSIAGDAAPGYALLHRETAIELYADIHNQSNVPVTLDFSYVLRNPDGSEIVQGNQSVQLGPEQTNSRISLSDFPYTFAESGDYLLEIFDLNGAAVDDLATGLVFVPPSIRLEATQSLNPAEILPLEGISVDSRIEIKGVDGE